MTGLSANHMDTPLTTKWRKQLSFESDEECVNLRLDQHAQRSDDSKLRTRLFEDEDSRDSGLGMSDHLDDDLSFELPVRKFAIFNGKDLFDETNFVCCDKFGKVNKKVSDNVPDCHSKSSQKRVRPITIHETSPIQQKRRRRNSFAGDREDHGRNSQLYHGVNALFTACTGEGPSVGPLADPITLHDSGPEDESLSGDCGRKLILPTIAGKHRDLNSVTPDTLARVLKLECSDSVAEAVVIDCRYPYEYEGGHIKGAINCFTKDDLMERFFSNHQLPVLNSNDKKRSILIFHCEFSSERAPKMSRFLREMDRKANQWCYPKLNYPEIYLLHGGYKNFFEHHTELCTPLSYVPMHHTDHREDMRKFRLKSKSWSGDKKTRSVFGF